MAQSLKVDNFASTNIVDKNTLDADAIAGANVLTLLNNYNTPSTQLVMIGQLGQEGAELQTVSSPVGATQISITPLNLNHDRGEPVTLLFGNQLNIYRANNIDGNLPADSSFSLLGTVNIDYTEQNTGYSDPAGNANYWYKFTYFNSNTMLETSIADSQAMRGGGYGHYVSIAAIRAEAGLENNQNISDSLIDSRRIDAENEINGELFEVYTLPFAIPIPSLITQVNRMIAAGLVLVKEYGTMTTGSSKDGDKKLLEGREMLDRIKSREITIMDLTGKSLMLQSLVTSWPDSTTDQSSSNLSPDQLAANNQDTGPKFRSSMRF